MAEDSKVKAEINFQLISKKIGRKKRDVRNKKLIAAQCEAI